MTRPTHGAGRAGVAGGMPAATGYFAGRNRMGRRKRRVDVDDSELHITEIALRVLMDAIQSHGLPEEPSSGRLHECSACGSRGVWGPNWMWFGSYADEENGLKTCSRACFEHVCRLEITNA